MMGGIKMRKKTRIYMVVFILMIPVLYLIAKYNTYAMLNWKDTTTTYLSSPLGRLLNSTQTHTHVLLIPLYILFVFLMLTEYQEYSLKEYLIMIGILVVLAGLNFLVLYKIFLPSIWWTWSHFALVHAVTLAFFCISLKKNGKGNWTG